MCLVICSQLSLPISNMQADITYIEAQREDKIYVNQEAAWSVQSGVEDSTPFYDAGITGKDQLAGDDGDNLITPGMKGEQVDEKSDKDRKFDPEQGDYKGFA